MVVPLEVYPESMALVSVVEAFIGHLPPSVVYSYVISNSLEDQTALLPNQIEILVHLQHVGSRNVDHVGRVVSSPSPCVL